MSLFTRNKVFFAADKTTYWEYDPGAVDAALFVNNVEVLTATTGNLTVSGTMVVSGALTASGAVGVAGRLAAEGGMSWSVEGSSAPVVGGSTLSNDKVVSIISGSTGALVYTVPAPSSAGIVKIVVNASTVSTGHIDFTTGVLLSGYSTANNINLLPNGVVGMISLTTVAYKILFPTTVATVIVSTLST